MADMYPFYRQIIESHQLLIPELPGGLRIGDEVMALHSAPWVPITCGQVGVVHGWVTKQTWNDLDRFRRENGRTAKFNYTPLPKTKMQQEIAVMYDSCGAVPQSLRQICTKERYDTHVYPGGYKRGDRVRSLIVQAPGTSRNGVRSIQYGANGTVMGHGIEEDTIEVKFDQHERSSWHYRPHQVCRPDTFDEYPLPGGFKVGRHVRALKRERGRPDLPAGDRGMVRGLGTEKGQLEVLFDEGGSWCQWPHTLVDEADWQTKEVADGFKVGDVVRALKPEDGDPSLPFADKGLVRGPGTKQGQIEVLFERGGSWNQWPKTLMAEEKFKRKKLPNGYKVGDKVRALKAESGKPDLPFGDKGEVIGWGTGIGQIEVHFKKGGPWNQLPRTLCLEKEWQKKQILAGNYRAGDVVRAQKAEKGNPDLPKGDKGKVVGMGTRDGQIEVNYQKGGRWNQWPESIELLTRKAGKRLYTKEQWDARMRRSEARAASKKRKAAAGKRKGPARRAKRVDASRPASATKGSRKPARRSASKAKSGGKKAARAKSAPAKKAKATRKGSKSGSTKGRKPGSKCAKTKVTSAKRTQDASAGKKRKASKSRKASERAAKRQKKT